MVDGRDTPFRIARSETEWEGYEYTCLECDESAGAIAAIEHANGCGVSSVREMTGLPEHPTPGAEWVTCFSESTTDMIREIMQEVTWVMTGRSDRDVSVDSVESVVCEMDGVRWVSQGSSNRIAVGLGRTSPYGEFHVDDRRGVVLKIDPNARFDSEYTPVSANVDELLTWETAVDTGTHPFFADIITCSPDGAWLAMEACTPISLRVREEMKSRDMIHDSGGEEYINQLHGVLQSHGWENPDYGTGPDWVE